MKPSTKASKTLVEAKAERYFTYHTQDDGRFVFEENRARIEKEESMDAYYTLQEVERAFRGMKDFLRLRPIYHWNEKRVKSHVFVCVPAYLLEKALEHRLKVAGLHITARKAFDLLSDVHLVANRLGDTPINAITRSSPQVSAIIKAVGLPPLPGVLPLGD